jgi:hypothetical protein
MPFDINKFQTNIRDFGYLDNNSFSVLVQTPRALTGASLSNQGTPTAIYKIAQNMEFRIDQVKAPGISLITTDINRYGLGPTQKQPFGAQFQEINISVLGDHYCEFWQYWYQWTRAVFQFNGSVTGNWAPNYTADYKENYSTTMIIFIYDHYGNIIQKINLYEAFPTSIREFPLSWGDSNLLKINVQIAYTEYTIENSTIEKSNQQNRNNAVLSGFNRETVTN